MDLQARLCEFVCPFGRPGFQCSGRWGGGRRGLIEVPQRPPLLVCPSLSLGVPENPQVINKCFLLRAFQVLIPQLV